MTADRWSRWRRSISCGAGPDVLPQPWRNVEYCCIDFETTGLDVDRDSILSYGAVTISGGRIRGSSAVYGLARPDCAISPASTTVHALRSADCADAPSDLETADALRTILSGKLLVAHAAWIERGFLKRYLGLVGGRPSAVVIDTAALARATGWASVDGAAEPSLEWLAARQQLPVHTPHHALGDAMTTATVFLALTSALAKTAPRLRVADLVKLSRKFRLR